MRHARWRFAWAWFLATVVAAGPLPGCIIGKPCVNPCPAGTKCVGGLCVPIQPTPPPTCPATCPEASHCTDPAKGCEPIPPPGDVCKCPSAPCCDCWYWPSPSTAWQHAECPSGQVCSKEKLCEAASCANLVCPPPGEPQKTACADTAGGPTCYKPEPECPPCAAGFVCTDPAVGCVPKPLPPSPGETTCIPPSSDDNEHWKVCGTESDSPCPSRPLPAPRNDELTAAVNAVGDRCGKDRAESLDLVAAALRKRGVCAGHWADSVLYVAADNVWVQQHVVTASSGCLNPGQGQNAYEGTWYWLGQEWPLSETCPPPTPDPSPSWWHLACKWHSPAIVDCTQTTSYQYAYCAETGFGPGRGGCPMRKEGHPERLACEGKLGKLHVVAYNGNASCRQVAPTMFESDGKGECAMCNADESVCSATF